jgi:hypothetical protein
MFHGIRGVTIVLACLLLVWTSPAFAGRPLVVDDAKPVAQGAWELEFGLAHTQAQDDSREETLPAMALTYGVLKGLDFGLSLQHALTYPQGDMSVHGLRDLHLMSKYSLVDEASYPAFALALDVKLPTADRGTGFSTGRVDAQVTLIATKHYFPLGIDVNLGYSIVDSPPDANLKNRLFGGLALRYGLSERWRLVGELYGLSRASTAEKPEANFQLGLRFRPNLPVFFDVGLGRSLLPSGTKIQATLGLTWSTSPKF